MQLDRLDIPFGIIVVGILLIIINLSIEGTFGFNINMRKATWAGFGLMVVGLTGLSIGTCNQFA